MFRRHRDEGKLTGEQYTEIANYVLKHPGIRLKHKKGSRAMIKAVFFDWIGTIN